MLEKLLKILRTLLTEAQENASQSIEEFVADKVRRMGAMIGHYFTAFTSLNVMSRNGLEEMIKQMYKHESIRDLEEELYEIEDEWDSFLKDVDAKMNSSTEALKKAELIVGSRGPCELQLRDVLTGRLVQSKMFDRLCLSTGRKSLLYIAIFFLPVNELKQGAFFSFSSCDWLYFFQSWNV